MPPSSSLQRKHLIRWLYLVAGGHLLGGLLLSWAAPSGLFDQYLASLEQAFWGAVAPLAAREQQTWWLALFGATLQSYSLYMLALIHIGSRVRQPMVWGWLMAGLLLWAPQDIVISLQAGVWSHLLIDSLALLALVPPLLWLYRHDRSAA
ncbi:cell division protein [Pseudomonas sp. 21LCFQ02]|uniref:cell division protein n=1 Tax=Pseudomonas sp. 21LCFQ02 TaxID=2957505 RepID=UPI00209B349F|nr:cell division protein [Pseudomonas sp. 21LCFQ02]MCO8171292.1 cell division protein [Pseudomonas sp. 21LCFQ02]